MASYRKPMHAASIFLHITTANDAERETVFAEILKVLDTKGIKYDDGDQFHERGWNLLPQIKLNFMRGEALEE
jgi:hypothetical protein